jgi:hypothetical protein
VIRHEDHRSPTTKAQYRAEIIRHMIEGGELAKRYIAENKEVKWNPTGLPETMEFYQPAFRHSIRRWKVVQEMEREGVVAIARGSWEAGEVYLIAGEKWTG